MLHPATHGYFRREGLRSLSDLALEAAADDHGDHGNRGDRGDRGDADLGTALVGNHPGLLSGLVRAGVDGPPAPDGEVGYLTAEEVSWLELSSVELVVLSACETGLGRPRAGEGLLGLRRAFETAGAATGVTSPWSVPDAATADLMRAFYENLLLRGLPRAAALRASRERHGEDRAATWGAFVLSGEWR